MKTQFRSLARGVVIVGVGLLSTVALAASTLPSAGARPELGALIDRLDGDVPLILSAYDVPGMTVAVVRDGATAWSAGYGVASADGTEMTPDTVFQVASISKTLTAWGVMHLVETGAVDLDAPIESYLTRWALPPSAFDSSDVTVARVLSHTAGLNRIDQYPLPGDRPLPTIEESLDGDNGGGQSLRIAVEPGQQFLYSSGGYTLLQLMIEEVTGQRFSDYMQDVVLDPLGMTRSTFDPERVSSQATGHYPTGQPVPRYRVTDQASGGLYSTVLDLARFLSASVPGPDGEAVGRGVLTSASVEVMMLRRDVPDGSVVSLGYLNDHLQEGITTTGNNGRNVGWITNMVMIPELGEGIVILTNSYTESTGMTLRSWTQWLGVSSTATTQRAEGDTAELQAIMLGGAATIFAGVLAVVIVTAVQAARGRRRWVWHAGASTPRRLVTRGAIAAVAIGGLLAFLAWPERLEYVLLLPLEAGTVLVAVVLAVLAVAVRVGTRKAI